MITRFAGPHSWLSNFHPIKILYEGIVYPSAEHAYQASKTFNIDDRRVVAEAPSPGGAKRIGAALMLRSDWSEELKLGIMRDIVRIKFKDPILRKKLLDTGEMGLVEGNGWDDTYWGVCRSVGHNHLGKILMSVRDELRKESF